MRAANGATIIPIAVVGRIDVAGVVEVEVVGVAEQVGGILIDVAAPTPSRLH